VVWFKRDLRVRDHAPLAHAVRSGPTVGLYILEPSVLGGADFDALHWWWVSHSLRELQASLAERGAQLLIRQGEAMEVLEQLRAEFGFCAIWSHIETGVDVTFRRDRAVARWAKSVGVEWREFAQQGVVRGLRDRDGWQRKWRAHMQEDEAELPDRIDSPAPVPSDPIPGAEALGLQHQLAAVETRAPDLVPGEAEAWRVLTTFLEDRGADYHKAMSSPLTAYRSCSRLSPYLAWGNISMRSVVQATDLARKAHGEGRADGDATAFPGRALQAFSSRLHWHCHFIQKLESEPAIEFHCFNRAYDGVREREFDPDKLAAWQKGRTGYPFVDACMRALQTRGWINFRMRAMLVSFAAYDLWLDWRVLNPFLARQFVDYEPGIHLSQLQMQSGVTGINTLRIYNPVKQGLDHDPEGVFIREWVPELAHLATPDIHEPWKGALPGAYVPRIAEHGVAVRESRAKLGAVRRTAFHRAEADRVYQEHGSRKRPPSRRKAKTKRTKKAQAEQLEFSSQAEESG
jgi:deoxyribodipyrimidine photo-lyase